MKLLREGCWSVRSESDPRWDGHGEALVGVYVIPREAQEHVDRKCQELGEKPAD